MKHIYQKKNDTGKTIVLLHGTGGNEGSLLSVTDYLDTGYNVLSIRGSVNENGALRYFKRKEEGVYDTENLEENAQKLVSFIKETSQTYEFNLEDVVFLGFSNGTNMALHILLHQEFSFNKGVLLAPLYPLEVDTDRDLSNMTLFVSMGRHDPICPMPENERLLNIFAQLNIDVTNTWVHTHEITQPMLAEVKEWFKDKLS